MNSKPTSSADIREAFLQYFASKGHERVASSSLVPGDDPTLLFTNAGMVPFKDVFLGQEKRPYNRAASSQRCVRAGGKHNDLENVGYTARHHTFFEMLGNFSFGDYFKADAIQFAWDFLTKVLGLPEEKLWVTVHVSDDEAERIWKEDIGVSPERFSKLDEDNFWQMGDTGPCGPSSEIFYDHGESIFGDPPGGENDDGDRYIEIWNLVFMQYVKSVDGKLTPLPNPSIDTGMGLERIAAVMQGVHNNYDIDLFKYLLEAAAKIIGIDDTASQSLRVIADHIRSCAFLIVDGVVPSNEGRGYVLRRIMRRAIRHGHKLGAEGAFFYRLAAPLADVMGEAYPALKSSLKEIESVITSEEKQFAKTLDNGMQVLSQTLDALKGKQIPGDVVFKLYDTFGFPVDLTNDIAREQGYSLDLEGYDQAMQRQRERSRDAGSFQLDYTQQIKVKGATEFTGYDTLDDSVEVVALFDEGGKVQNLKKGQAGILVLASTPFYAESGGQIGDKGILHTDTFKAKVKDVKKQGEHHLHHIEMLEGDVKTGDAVSASVDAVQRQSIVLNHSATHLLHAALREALGGHVMQKGSLNDAERLRFDFAHTQHVTANELTIIEDKVNEQIRLNTLVETELTDMEGAQEKGAMALFGEKYSDEVRLLTMGNGYSVELCGGTHVKRTGDIGLFKITAESGVAAGVRRIEAITGAKALAFMREKAECLQAVNALLKAKDNTLFDKVKRLIDTQKQQEKQVQQLQAKLATSSGGDLSSNAVLIGDIKVLAARLDGVDRKGLLATLDQMKNKLGKAVVLLAAVDDKGITLVAGVSKNLTDKIQAGQLMKDVAQKLGGKGGGRPDTAQGGGQDIKALPDVLGALPAWVEGQLE